MTSSVRTGGQAASDGAGVQPLLLLAGLCTAVGLRVLTSGAAGPQSPVGGVVFAGSLAGLSLAAGTSWPRLSVRALSTGVPGGLILAAVALVRSGLSVPLDRSVTGFLPWLLLAGTVAVAEEALLRGALFAVLSRRRGEFVAVVVGAAAFAGLHVPLYGWPAAPLDLAVGLVLGTVRVLSGTWAAPAVAHVLADAAGWWLR